MSKLLSLLSNEPRFVRPEIAKQVEKIALTPEGRTYVALGAWYLCVGVAVSMVPGASNAPRARWRLRCHLPRENQILPET
jgi:hypothetical protein